MKFPKLFKKAAALHYLLKDDLMKLEVISQETRLLCRNRIDTVEQLCSYKESLETEMADLLQKRKGLYSQSRKMAREEKKAMRLKSAELRRPPNCLRKQGGYLEGKRKSQRYERTAGGGRHPRKRKGREK